MKRYIVHTVDKADWTKAASDSLEQCSWSPGEAPGCTVQALVLRDTAFMFLLKSKAAPVRAENTLPDSAVWEDSCLECFFSFGEDKYVNLEVNANSALRASVGVERHGRLFLKDLGITMPKVEASVLENGWQVVYTVPFETIESLWKINPAQIKEFRANFYSCGDKTPVPHYSSWNPVETAKPDFHRPEYFGLLTIEK